MSDAALRDRSPEPVAFAPPRAALVPSGIGPLDDRVGGLQEGGSYLVVGTPGPAKLVAVLHFLHAGVTRGEPSLLLTSADAQEILGVARAWGPDLERWWLDGTLRILGFKDDFELRAARSIEPEEVMEELELLAGPDLARIAVDPGWLFLAGGARTPLGSAFLAWARAHPAVVCATLSVDGSGASLPASAEWLAHATTGRLLIEARADGLHEISLVKAVPDLTDRGEAISVQLKPGAGLVRPGGLPARRDRDRAGVDESKVLLVSLGGSHTADLEAWAREAFTAEVVSEPFGAVERAQGDASFGGVLVHAPRSRVREAISACRALRPLTRAAIVFASDDAIRATDRIQILEAGADDCLSGGIAFPELDLRLRQAIASGSKPLPEGLARDGARSSEPHAGPEGGRVAEDAFRSELERRATDPKLKFFCVLAVTPGALDPEQLAEILTQQVRADEGDLVCITSNGCAVLLQGAREAQLGPFLGRLQSRLDETAGRTGEAAPRVTVLSHPAHAEQIIAAWGVRGGARA
jgi:DNA-binding NarL/FixJ family response regulator